MSKLKKHELLKSILRPLVDEWGASNVSDAVREVEIDQREMEGSTAINRHRRRTSPTLPAFARILKSLNTKPAERAKLQILAERYRVRSFLPTIGDVRHFLSMRGISVEEFRDRADAVRDVFIALSQMQARELDEILLDSSLAGPSKLGPLSNAIKEAGELQRNSFSVDTVNTSNKES